MTANLSSDRKALIVLLFVSFCVGSCGGGAATEATVEMPAALRAEVQTADWAQSWWMGRHKEKLAGVKALGKKIELLFIGDSITHGWESKGSAVWNEYYAKRKAFNLGFGGDRTEQVLWRLRNGEVKGLSPKVVVLMIGTNNTGHRQDPAEETAAGIAAILDELKQRLPQTKVLLLAIFPRSADKQDSLRVLNAEINEKLSMLADEKRVFFLDINRVFVEKDGRLPRNIMPDLLHPNATGYRLWARAMEPTLSKLMGEKSKSRPPKVLKIWPDKVPGEVCTEAESSATKGNVTRISFVAEPTLSVYALKGKKAKPAVLVLPGGGYHILAYDLEGTEIAEWLNSIGHAAAILKYRVPKNREGALQDAQRALGLLRHRASEWNIDPNQIGVLGFSAGGNLSARLSTHYLERSYPMMDAADQSSCRPDFTVLVYPAYLGETASQLASDIPVTSQTPPAFIVQTQDDRKYVSSATAYYLALSAAKVPAELHLYPTGGHGYGSRPSPYPVSQWPSLCATWLSRLD